MNPYDAMINGAEDPERRRALARMLRGQAATGGALSTSSIPEVSAQGQSMQEQSMGMAQQIGLQNAKREQLRSQELQNSRNNAARMVGKDERAGYKISPSERKEARTKTGDWRAQVSIIDEWDPNKQDPVLGEAKAWFGRKGIGPLSDRMEEVDAWWAEYSAWENQARNRLFGSALTAHEKAAWDKTSINRNMQPDLVDERIKARRAIITSKAAQSALTYLVEGHDPEAVATYFRGVLPAEALQSRETLRRFADKADDEVNKILSTAGEERNTENGTTYRRSEIEAEMRRRNLSPGG